MSSSSNQDEERKPLLPQQQQHQQQQDQTQKDTVDSTGINLVFQSSSSSETPSKGALKARGSAAGSEGGGSSHHLSSGVTSEARIVSMPSQGLVAASAKGLHLQPSLDRSFDRGPQPVVATPDDDANVNDAEAERLLADDHPVEAGTRLGDATAIVGAAAVLERERQAAAASGGKRVSIAHNPATVIAATTTRRQHYQPPNSGSTNSGAGSSDDRVETRIDSTGPAHIDFKTVADARRVETGSLDTNNNNDGTNNGTTNGGDDPQVHNAIVAAGFMKRVARQYRSSTGHEQETSKTIKYLWEAAPRGKLTNISSPEPSVNVSTGGAAGGSGGGAPRPTSSPIAKNASPIPEDEFGEDGPPMDPPKHQLDQLRATAIAGNDISSSCLYAAGITVQQAGIWAPIATLIVVFILYLYRAIYGEVGTALPMNGGTYTATLNTATKKVAALAGLLSVLSYIATATSSAASAAAYAHYGYSEINDLGMTLGIIIIFALLNLLGVSESANVATLLFVIHITTVATLMIGGFVYMCRDDFTILTENYQVWTHTNFSSYRVNIFGDENATLLAHTEANPKGSWYKDIIYGFFAAAVGITGFESASNYIEEQKEGVYLKVLRNLWLLVFLINPAITLITLGVLPMPELVKAEDFSLAELGGRAIGPWMKYVTIVDAVLVLSGAVLTAYVGIGGLLQRMTMDAIIPRIFMQRNKFRGSYHVIILTFCSLCCFLRYLVGNNLEILTSVYSTAFLGVMCLFAISALLLKQKRDSLRRDTKAPVPFVIVAFTAMFLGLIGTFMKLKSIMYFAIFFAIGGSVMVLFMTRISIMKWTAVHLGKMSCMKKPAAWLRDSAVRLRRQRIVFFSTCPDVAFLNKIITYIAENEDGRDVYIVYCVGEDAELGCLHTAALDAQFETACATLDMIHPRITINCVRVQRAFNPAAVDQISKTLKVPVNFMFIGCPRKKFFPQFVGMRVITHYKDKQDMGKETYEGAILPTSSSPVDIVDNDAHDEDSGQNSAVVQ